MNHLLSLLFGGTARTQLPYHPFNTQVGLLRPRNAVLQKLKNTLPAILLLGVLSIHAERPNVIILISDDQGYGDFGAMGNEIIETPNIDAMAKRSVLWDNFYVSPVCSPTRASLMTGRYNHRTYCVDTWLGRSMMHTDEVTIAEVLKAAGYATGVFGKWHLGDNYPMRTTDQGFEASIVHRGGGLAQPADPIENERRYTDPILIHNDREVQTQGYCTDVYFDYAIDWIKEVKKQDKPFFAYLPTNAPHGPYHDVPEDLRKYYLKKDLKSLFRAKVRDEDAEIDKLSRIAAMITNWDQNIGRLFETLKKTGQFENTLVFLMTDNGPNTMRYVGDLRGMKTNIVEGGIRTPLWSHWPAKLGANQTAETTVAAHIDIFPTIVEATGAKLPAGLQIDGRSLMPQLMEPAKRMAPRTTFMQIHRGTQPQRYHNFMVRDSMWKLVHPSGFGTQTFEGEADLQLYNLEEDPGESTNLKEKYPNKFNFLKGLYDDWFDDVMSNVLKNPGPPDIIIDGNHENPSVLTWQDRVADRWSEGSDGHWQLNFARDGRFDIQVDMPREHAPDADGELILSVGSNDYSVPVKKGTSSIRFPIIDVTRGSKNLKASIHYQDGRVEGGYQVRVTER